MVCENNTRDQLEERATYLILTSLFLSLLAAFSFYKKRRSEIVSMKPLDFVMLALATYRLGRLAAYDKVMEPLRRPFTETTLDSSGSGQTVVPRGAGAQRALGELISCPICTGTWIAAALIYGLNLAPHFARTLMIVMSAIGAGELLDAATEAMEWTGQARRIQAGSRKQTK
jgi:hypothetical protein